MFWRRSISFGVVVGLIVALVFVVSPIVDATINRQINFQGKLTNTNGTNVSDGNYSIRFRIYNHASNDAANPCAANSCLWEETQGSVAVDDGIFHVQLGSSTALPGSVDFDASELYLGVKIDTDPEMTPRIRFSATPYSFNSDELDGLNSTDFVQLAQGLQTDASNSQPSIGINKTGSAGILQLQDAGADVMTISGTGAYAYTLDATDNPSYTITNAGSSDITTNLSGTGDVVFQDNGSTFLTLSDTGAYTYTLDATDNPAYTITNAGTSDITTNLSGTGDFVLQDNGVTFLTLSDTGAVSITLDATDNPAYTLTNAGTSNVITNLSGTGDVVFQDNGSTFLTLSDVGGFDLTLDATDNPTYSLTNNGSGGVTTNLAGTGDFILQDNGSTFMTISDTGSFDFTLDATDNPTFTITNSGTGAITFNLASTGDFIIQDNGTAVWSFKNDSTTLANLAGSSTTAFQLQDAGTDIFVVDTTNSRIYIGNPTADGTGTLLVLDSKNSAGNPTGTNGSMYYNSNDHTFRCYRGINATDADGSWEACGTTPVDRSYQIYDDFMGGLTTTGNIGSLGWVTNTIGAAGTYSYNNATPAVTSDRPGILRLRTPTTLNQGSTMQLSGLAGTGSTALGAGQNQRFAIAVAATTSHVVRVGLHNETTGTAAPTTGVYWEFDAASSANWRYCYVNATPTATCAASGTAVAANTFVTLEIRLTATGVGTSAVDFFINGTKSSVSGITVNTTNLVSPAMTCYTTAAVAKDCFIDYYQLTTATSARR